MGARFFFLLLFFCGVSFVDAQVITPFTIRHQSTQRGGIRYLSNTSVSCSGIGCGAGRAEVPPAGTSTDNGFTAAYVDIDSDGATFSSSSDTLNLAAGSTVTWAGLYWGGEITNAAANYATRNQVRIKVDAGSYQNLTADALQDNAVGFDTYHCFKDITSIVQAGTLTSLFTVANVAARVGGTNRFGGWTIVVVYANSSESLRQLTVFNGLVNVSGSNPISDVTVSGFITAVSGAVTFEAGLVSYDGDRSSTGDQLFFNGGSGFVNISDAVNPLNDIFNSTLSYNGVAKISPAINPGYTNTLGYDADIFIPNNVAKNYIGNAATSATLRLATGGETYLTQVVTLAIDTSVPDLTLSKSDGNVSTSPGATLAYTLSYSNIGSIDASGVVISDVVPANTTFNAAASSGVWSCSPNNNAGSTCTQSIGTVAAGASSSATFAVTVANTVAAGVTQISNSASISESGNIDPNSDNDTGSDTTPLIAQPDMSITKSDGGTSTTPGGTVSYTLNYSNAGNQGATGVAITETVPANTTFNAGASTAGWSCVPNNNAGSNCTITVGSVTAGANGSVTFAVTVPNPLGAGVSQISNTASIADDGANGADPTSGNNSGNDTTPVNAAPDLAITKSDGGVSTSPGGTVSYTLNYSNDGNQNATGVVITETVPADTTFTGAGWSCTPNNNAGSTCTRSIGNVNAGASGSVTFAVTVVNPVVAGVTEISNTATIADDGANGTDPASGNNTANDTTPVNAAPDLTLTKSDGDASVSPGGTVSYTLNYNNAGNQEAAGVSITETVPANTTFNAGASTAGWSCVPSNNAGSTCTIAIGSVGASGNVTFAVTVANPVGAGVNQISNTASIADDGSNGTDTTPGDNTANDTTPVNAQPDLTITKSDSGASTTPGGTALYTLNYENVGNQGATGVVISETVPANTTFNPGPSTGGWTCVPNNNAGSTCTISIGNLNAGASGFITFAVTVINPVGSGVTQISNTATIADDGTNGADPTNGNNTANDTTPVDAAPDLAITKSDAGASVTPGATVAYTLDYSNEGNQDATGVVLSETVPLNTTFNSAASTSGWNCTPDNTAGSTCNLSIGTVNAGANASATFAVTIVNPVGAGVTEVSNTASIADDGSNGTDPVSGNNSSSETTPILAAPDLAVSKNDGGLTATPGSTIVYTISYSNGGNKDATGVVLTETVPANTTFNAGASTAGWNCNPDNNAGSACTFTIGNLNAAANGTADFAVTVAAGIPSGVSEITNTVSIADDGSNGTDPDASNNTGQDTTPMDAGPDFALTKDDGEAVAQPGDVVVYTLSVTNNGDQDASGVEITETVPAETTFDAASSTPGWSCPDGSAAGTTCVFAVGSLSISEMQTVAFAVSVNDSVSAGTIEIQNTASVADDGGGDPTPGNNIATDTTPLVTATPQEVAIDPAGRFIVYAGNSSGCAARVLLYQALYESGNPAGGPRQILPCGALLGDAEGIDLLRDGQTEEYFVSLGGSDSNDGKFILKIDVFGNIIIPAKLVVSASQFGANRGATALATRNRVIYMYIAGSGGNIYLARVNKATLVLRRIKRTNMVTSNVNALQVSQVEESFFLAFEQPGQIFKGFGLLSKGLSNDIKWRLSPRTDGGHETGSVSADGRVAISNDSDPTQDTLYLQLLRPDGVPIFDPLVVATDEMKSVDVSNVLSSNLRFVVFAVEKESGQGIYIQRVDAATGAKVGAKITIQ